MLEVDRHKIPVGLKLKYEIRQDLLVKQGVLKHIHRKIRTYDLTYCRISFKLWSVRTISI